MNIYEILQHVSTKTFIIVRRNYKEIFRGNVTTFDGRKPLAKAKVLNIGVKYDDYDERVYMTFNVT